VPDAETEKLADCPAVRVSLAGWVVMSGAVAVGGEVLTPTALPEQAATSCIIAARTANFDH
jgi:hypothetical protein